jgi:hypothetical protein
VAQEDSEALLGAGILGKSHGLDGVRASGRVAVRTPRRLAHGRGTGALWHEPVSIWVTSSTFLSKKLN